MITDISAVKSAIINSIERAGLRGCHKSMRSRYPSEYQMLFKLYPQLEGHNFSEHCYWILHNLTQFPICPTCKIRQCKFININIGYSKTCSNKCGANVNFMIDQHNKITCSDQLDSDYRQTLLDMNLDFSSSYAHILAAQRKDIYQYVFHRYDSVANLKSFPEKLYWFINDMTSYPICPVCNKQLNCKSFKNIIAGYSTYHPSCYQNYDVTKEKVRKTIDQNIIENDNFWKDAEQKRKVTKIKKGYDPNWNNKEKASETRKQNIENDPDYWNKIHKKQRDTNIRNGKPANWNNLEQAIQTNLATYGVKYSFQANSVKEKSKQTNRRKLGVDYPAQSESCWNVYRETCKKLYGYEYPTQSPDIQEKVQNTKRTNGTYGKSEEEDHAFWSLKFVFPHLIRQYKSNVYPFNCDFYDPDSDTYFEYNGFMTHGPHFFDKNDPKDIELLDKWNQKAEQGKPLYRASIETWTKRDVFKLHTAQENNLNYIVFWNLTQVINYVLNFKVSK